MKCIYVHCVCLSIASLQLGCSPDEKQSSEGLTERRRRPSAGRCRRLSISVRVLGRNKHQHRVVGVR